MRELDVLLTGWLECHYSDAEDSEKSAFERLLVLSDPELIRYLLGGESPADPEIASVVCHIRGDRIS